MEAQIHQNYYFFIIKYYNYRGDTFIFSAKIQLELHSYLRSLRQFSN